MVKYLDDDNLLPWGGTRVERSVDVDDVRILQVVQPFITGKDVDPLWLSLLHLGSAPGRGEKLHIGTGTY